MSRHKLSLNVFKGCTIFVQSKDYQDRTLDMDRITACINSRMLLDATHIEGAFGGWQIRADEAVQRVDALAARRSSLPPLGINSPALVMGSRPPPLPVHEEEPDHKPPKATLSDLFTPEPEDEQAQNEIDLSPTLKIEPRPAHLPVHEEEHDRDPPKATLMDLFTPEPEDERPQSDSDLSPAPTTPASPACSSGRSATPASPTIPSAISATPPSPTSPSASSATPASPAFPSASPTPGAEEPAYEYGPPEYGKLDDDGEDKVDPPDAKAKEGTLHQDGLTEEEDDELELLYDEEDRLKGSDHQRKVQADDNRLRQLFWHSEEVPVKFYLEGTSQGIKTIIEMFGGEVVDKQSARLCILPLDVGVRATEAAHRDIVERKGTHPLSQAVSHDYVWSCIKNSALGPTDKFLVKLPVKRYKAA
ncbi:uncharacterized protein LOC62_04G006188 [Vanrija pseudolonga]|uniref:BRCT domain-containing protein n=1 Tax=Vanrija pseudolonga TaxID=143232 RepID=A0AAF0YF87_9TREE|nr:hypothetical protein LOC62_04G006188 [Vanrija pseudolonga]